MADYQLPDSLPFPPEKSAALARIATRLKKIESDLQEQLINWGYAVCDAAIRRHLNPILRSPDGFPYSGPAPQPLALWP
jgi:NTE family protein